jgi:hypothetical protein
LRLDEIGSQRVFTMRPKAAVTRLVGKLV